MNRNDRVSVTEVLGPEPVLSQLKGSDVNAGGGVRFGQEILTTKYLRPKVLDDDGKMLRASEQTQNVSFPELMIMVPVEFSRQ